MSISLPVAFTKTAHKENWLVQLNHSGGSFTGIAFSDTTVGTAVWEDNTTNWEDEHDVWEDVETPAYTSSNFYHGCITSTSGIRDSLDLPNQKAQTGNVSFTCAILKIGGTDLSELLIGGSNNYINRSVKIYFQPDDATSLAACVQIYQGRLVEVSHDDATVDLKITAQRPWDNITAPSTRSTRGNYFPIVYGSFTENSSTYDSPAYIGTFSKSLHPVQVDSHSFHYYCLNHEDTGSTNKILHYYEPGADAFIPVELSYDAESYSGGFALKTDWHLKRHFKFKPSNFLSTTFGGDRADVIDGDADQTISDNVSSITMNQASAGTSTTLHKDNNFSIPSFDDPPDDISASNNHGLKIEMRWNMTGVTGTTGFSPSGGGDELAVNKVQIYNQSRYATGDLTDTMSPGTQFATNGTYNGDLDSGVSVTIAEVTSTSDGVATATEYNSYPYNQGLSIRVLRTVTSLSGDGSGTPSSAIASTLNVADVRLIGTLKMKDWNTSADGSKRISAVKQLYSGHDGFAKSYSGGSGTAATGLEAHRDLLKRACGFDAADADIYNWSDVEAARITDAWNIRYWALEPRPVIDILDQMQREFCFIGKFRHDGSYGYWHVKDSYSSGDVTATLDKNDISDLKISNSSFDDLLTSIVVNYEKHPAENRYVSTTSEDNSTRRTKYNIQTEENIKEVNLDMLVNNVTGDLDDDVNDGFIPYYGTMLLDVKTIVNCTIVNNTKGYLLETGDIIKFDPSNMDVKAFANNWTKYFMVTKINRTLGKVSIECREVG